MRRNYHSTAHFGGRRARGAQTVVSASEKIAKRYTRVHVRYCVRIQHTGYSGQRGTAWHRRSQTVRERGKAQRERTALRAGSLANWCTAFGTCTQCMPNQCILGGTRQPRSSNVLLDRARPARYSSLFQDHSTRDLRVSTAVRRRCEWLALCTHACPW